MGNQIKGHAALKILAEHVPQQLKERGFCCSLKRNEELRPTAVFSVAKQRLPDKIREYRSRHESVKAFAGGKMAVGDAVEVYLGKIRANANGFI